MSRAPQLVRRRFALLTDPAPLFNPFNVTVDRSFTSPIDVAHDLSCSSFRIFQSLAELFFAHRCPRIDDRRAVRPMGRAWMGSSGLDQPTLRVAGPFRIAVT